jgi:ApaG protein
MNPSSPSRAYTTVTRSIRVAVTPDFIPEQSRPENSTYVYAYRITVTNDGLETVQLLSRHWVIRDGFDRVEHVVGEGVVGQQPVVRPGESFSYASYCPLQTPTGTMKGSFRMKSRKEGELFDVNIDEFPLAHLSLVN